MPRPRSSVPPVENPLAPERQVCFRLVVASRAVVNVYRPILKHVRLTHPHYLVLLTLFEEEHRSLLVADRRCTAAMSRVRRAREVGHQAVADELPVRVPRIAGRLVATFAQIRRAPSAAERRPRA